MCVFFRKIGKMGGYKRKTFRGCSDAEKLLIAIKEVKLENKKPFAVATTYGFVYNSFKRYLKRFNAKVRDINVETEDSLLQTVREISSYGAPTVW